MSGMCDRNFWQDKLREQRFISHAIVDGRPYLAISRKVCPAINPATNSVLAAVTALQADDIDIAVKSSRASFASGVWSGLPPQERKTVLLRLSALILEHREELALLESASMGKPVNDALNMDIPGAAHVMAWYAESVDKFTPRSPPRVKGRSPPSLVKRSAWWRQSYRGTFRSISPAGNSGQRWPPGTA